MEEKFLIFRRSKMIYEKKDSLSIEKLVPIILCLEKMGITDIGFPMGKRKWAYDSDGNKWTKKEFFEFLLNECLSFTSEGKIEEGFGSLKDFDFTNILIEARKVGVVPYRMQQAYAFDIKWDTDRNDETSYSLPKNIKLPVGMTDADEISDYLSDTYGWCHYGFEIITRDVSIPAARIDYLASNGTVGYSNEFWDEKSLNDRLEEDNNCGVPMVVVYYEDSNGLTVTDYSKSFNFDPIPQGIKREKYVKENE